MNKTWRLRDRVRINMCNLRCACAVCTYWTRTHRYRAASNWLVWRHCLKDHIPYRNASINVISTGENRTKNVVKLIIEGVILYHEQYYDGYSDSDAPSAATRPRQVISWPNLTRPIYCVDTKVIRSEFKRKLFSRHTCDVILRKSAHVRRPVINSVKSKGKHTVSATQVTPAILADGERSLFSIHAVYRHLWSGRLTTSWYIQMIP